MKKENKMKFTPTQIGHLSLIHFHCNQFFKKKDINENDTNISFGQMADNREIGLQILNQLHLELERFFTFCDEMTEVEIDIVLKAIYTMSVYIMYMGMEESFMIDTSQITNDDFVKDCQMCKDQYVTALHFIHSEICPKFEEHDVFEGLKDFKCKAN